MKKFWSAIVLTVVLVTGAYGAETDPNEGLIFKKIAYKTTGGTALYLHVFEPKNRDTNTPVAAFLVFHGGAWFGGTPQWFYPHCRYFARLGMVTISAEYRLNKDGNSLPIAAVEDVKSAVRYVRSHAASFGIASNKIAVGGASSGGHLAACTALFDNFNDSGDNLKISSQPDALVLISAAIDTTERGLKVTGKYKQRMLWIRRPDVNTISPIEHIRKIASPCLVLHGTADEGIPFEIAQRFYKLMKDAGNNCQLVAFEGAGHGFSAYKDQGDNHQFERTMLAIENFFSSIGYLQSK
jgi:acetyl esterase/lipase